MATVLTNWRTTRQCEVSTGIWIDAEALEISPVSTGTGRCNVCVQEHLFKTAYVKERQPTQMRSRRGSPHAINGGDQTCIDVATATMPRTAMAPPMSPAYVVVHEKTGQSDEEPRANWPQPRKV